MPAARTRPCRRGGARARARAARPRGRAGGLRPPAPAGLAPAGAGAPRSGVSAGAGRPPARACRLRAVGGEAGTAGTAGWEAALEALRAAGPAADGPLYATAIGACCEAGEFAKAAELHKAAALFGVAAAPEGLAAALRAAVQLPDPELAAEVVAAMRERGLALPPGLLQGAFGVLAEAKRHEALLGYVDAMGTEAILEGGGPAVNVAVKVFAKAGELDRAIEVVEAAIKAQCEIPRGAYDALVLALSFAGEMQKAEDVMEWRDYL